MKIEPGLYLLADLGIIGKRGILKFTETIEESEDD